MNTSIYLPASMVEFIPRHVVQSGWAKHAAFGYDLVAALQPSVVVELGTQTGFSFFCFCQSMVEREIEGACYAVDSWKGDAHTGPYGEEVYRAVSEHAQTFYPNIARLMRMNFDEALGHFDDASIDLLHIDGLHTYEAVKEDFGNWYPKVRPGGIIFLHDIHVRMKDFGVWRFWEETSPHFDSFEFSHCFGLGVLSKPGGPERDHPLFHLLFADDQQQHVQLRSFYKHASEYALLKQQFAIATVEKAMVPQPNNDRIGRHGPGGSPKSQPGRGAA